MCFAYLYTYYNFKMIYSKIIWTLVGGRDAVIMTYMYLHVLLYTRVVGVCVSVYAYFGGKAKQVCVWVAIVWGQMAIGPKRNNKNKTKPLYCFCFNLLRNFARTYRIWENWSKKKTSTTAPVYVFHVWFRQKKIVPCSLNCITCILYYE